MNNVDIIEDLAIGRIDWRKDTLAICPKQRFD